MTYVRVPPMCVGECRSSVIRIVCTCRFECAARVGWKKGVVVAWNCRAQGIEGEGRQCGEGGISRGR